MLLYWLLGLSLIALFVEAYLLRRAVRSIPIRIHVNGTRGKSTVTRYIAAGLRAGGYSVAEKITGIVPTYFSPARQSRILRRRGIPRVQEQVSIVRRAAADRAQALVIECMSLQPEYQRMESRIISPTVSVITNVKNDHREVMGNSIYERIAALSESVQPGATVLTAERNAFQELRERITDKQGVLIAADILDRAVPATAHKANVEIAVTACSLIGIDRAVATDGIMQFIAEESTRILKGLLPISKFGL